MMDITKLSDSDLQQIAKGDLRMLSEEGLRFLAGADGGRQERLSRQAAADAKEYDPTSGMSVFEKGAAGFGKAFTDIGRGAGQMLGMVSRADVEEARKMDAPLMKTGAGMAGNIIGNVAAALPTALVPGALSIPGSMAGGAVMGLLNPVGEDDSRIMNAITGAGVGGGSVLAGRALLGAGKAGKALVEPFTRKGQDSIVGRTINRFADGGSVMPQAAKTSGWMPTLAEATQNKGLAILEQGAATADPQIGAAFANRVMDQNAAAMAAIDKIAGTSRDVALAKGVREMMTERLYKEAAEAGLDKGMAKAIKPQIDNLMARPSMGKVLGTVKEIFGEEGVELAKSGSVRGLQYTKQAMDDLIEKASSPASSIGKNQLRALQQTRSDLISVMEDLTPKLRQADVNYKLFSRPVNEMAAAGELSNKLKPALMDFAPGAPSRLKPQQYAEALRNIDDLMPKLTGYPGATVENTMSPGAMQSLRGVGEDLAKRSVVQDTARGIGSNTARNLASQNVLRQFLGPMGFPQSFLESRALPSLLRPIDFAMRAQEPAIQARLAQALMEPEMGAVLAAMNSSPYATGLLGLTSLRSMQPVSFGLLGNALQE